MMLYLLALCVFMFISEVESLSCCKPVDSIFIFQSDLIVQDKNDDKIEAFLKSLIYEATSEWSGIGVLAYDVVPHGFSNPALGLTETLGANTANSKNAIASNLNFAQLGFYSKNKMNGDNTIELNDAIASAHDLFVSQSAGRELEALFIMDVETETINRNETCQNAMNVSTDTNTSIEAVFYLQIDDDFAIQEIYDCHDQTEVHGLDTLTDLYDITCPTTHTVQGGAVKFNKKTQGIELGSIISCDLIPEYNDDKQSYELSPQSTIIVHDDLNDDMSYEIGYILMAIKGVYELLPKECNVPVLKIVHVTNKSIVADNVRELRINVTLPSLFDYVSYSNVEESDDDVPYMKPDTNYIDPDAVQQARQIISEQRRRRLYSWDDFLLDAIHFAFGPGYAFDEWLKSCADEIKETIETIDDVISYIPTFGADCSEDGCEFTFSAALDEEFDADPGTVSVDASISVSLTLAMHTYGPRFGYEFPWVIIEDLGAKLYGTFRLNASAKVFGSGQLDFGSSSGWVLFTYLTNQPIVHWIGGYVPIVIWPSIGVGIEGALNSAFAINANYEYYYESSFEIGARIVSNEVQFIRSFEQSSHIIDNTAFDGAEEQNALNAAVVSCPSLMSFEVSIPIKIGVEFYLLVTPHITVRPSIKGEVTTPYSGCDYDDGGCTTNGYPTGILFDPEVTLAVDAGIRATTIGSTITWLTGLPNEAEFTVFELTVYDIPSVKSCQQSGFEIPVLVSCCSSSISSLSCASSGITQETCEIQNDNGDGYLYIFNQDRGTMSALCGQDANCWCCRMEAPSSPEWSNEWQSGNAYFRLQNVASGKCIFDTWYGAFWYWDCATSTDQYWILDDLTTNSGYFRLKSRQTYKCIVNRNAGYFSAPNSWDFDDYTCTTYDDMYWYLYDERDDGSFRLRNKHTHNCMFQNDDGRFGVAECDPSYTDQYFEVSDVTLKSDVDVFIPQRSTPRDGATPDLTMFGTVSRLYHKNSIHLVAGVFGVMVMLNLICLFKCCGDKCSKNDGKVVLLAMTDSDDEQESELDLNI
eukprot:82678_1